MLEQQHGVCALCEEIPKVHGNNKTDPSRAILCVDHNHSNGRVRGLLCHRCNMGIGMLRDDPLFLIKVIAYLKRVID